MKTLKGSAPIPPQFRLSHTNIIDHLAAVSLPSTHLHLPHRLVLPSFICHLLFAVCQFPLSSPLDLEAQPVTSHAITHHETKLFCCSNYLTRNALRPALKQPALKLDTVTPTSSSMEEALPSTPQCQIMSVDELLFQSPTEVEGPYFSSPPTVLRYPAQATQPSATIPPQVAIDDPFWDPEPEHATVNSSEPESPDPDPWFPGQESSYDSDKENEGEEEQSHHWQYRGKQRNPDPAVVSLKTVADYEAYARRRGLVFKRGVPKTPKKRRRSQDEKDLETQPSPTKKAATTSTNREKDLPVFQRPVHLQSLRAFGELCNEHEQHHNLEQPQHYHQYPQSPLHPGYPDGLGFGNLNLDSGGTVGPVMEEEENEEDSAVIMGDYYYDDYSWVPTRRQHVEVGHGRMGGAVELDG